MAETQDQSSSRLPPSQAASDDTADLPKLENLAHATVLLERVRALDASTVVLGPGFADPRLMEPGHAALFQPRATTESLRSYHLRDVPLDASLMALFHGALPIRETLYMALPADRAHARIKPRPLIETDPTEHYVVACNRSYRNYYHWLTQALPTIDWAVRSRHHQRVTLVLPPLGPMQEETLALAGLSHLPRLTVDVAGHYRLASAEYAEFLGERMAGVVSLTAADTFARLRRSVPPASDASPVLYVARTDATRRVLRNEAALIAMLQRRGVRSVVPGELPVTQQIALFRAARLVIGAHGGGLTNLVFCEPGTHVCEMVPSHDVNICFSRLAQGGRLHYWAELFPSQRGASVHETSWEVDLAQVADRLEVIERAMRG